MSDERAQRPRRRRRLPLLGRHVPGPLRRGGRARRAGAPARPRRRPPAPDAAPGAGRGPLHARPARRGGHGARRRRRGGAAGRDHAEHGVDAAQPRAAGRGRRRSPRRARHGGGGAGADATAGPERPVGLGGHGGRARGGDGRAQPARRRRPRLGASALRPDPGRLAAMGFEALATRLRSTSAAATRRRGSAAAAEAHAAALGSRWRPPGRSGSRRRSRCDAGDPRAPPARALRRGRRRRSGRRRVEAALSRMLAARALAAAGDTDARGRAARAGRGDVRRPAARCPTADAAEQQLRQLGRTHPPPHPAGAADGDGVASLTGRELEVARLVVDRRTNQRDRRRALPQPQDRRDAPAQHVPQARRLLARRPRPEGSSRQTKRRHNPRAQTRYSRLWTAP